MTEEDLKHYIIGRKYYCCLCKELQRRVMLFGIGEVRKWNGGICGEVEDMKIRLEEIETGVKHEPLDFKDSFYYEE